MELMLSAESTVSPRPRLAALSLRRTALPAGRARATEAASVVLVVHDDAMTQYRTEQRRPDCRVQIVEVFDAGEIVYDEVDVLLVNEHLHQHDLLLAEIHLAQHAHLALTPIATSYVASPARRLAPRLAPPSSSASRLAEQERVVAYGIASWSRSSPLDLHGLAVAPRLRRIRGGRTRTRRAALAARTHKWSARILIMFSGVETNGERGAHGSVQTFARASVSDSPRPVVGGLRGDDDEPDTFSNPPSAPR